MLVGQRYFLRLKPTFGRVRLRAQPQFKLCPHPLHFAPHGSGGVSVPETSRPNTMVKLKNGRLPITG